MGKYKSIILNGLLILLSCLIVSCVNKKDAFPHNIIPLSNTVGKYNILNLSICYEIK